MQIMGVYEDAMTAMESAGATLVYFNMTPVFDMPGNEFDLTAFEEPREISTCKRTSLLVAHITPVLVVETDGQANMCVHVLAGH